MNRFILFLVMGLVVVLGLNLSGRVAADGGGLGNLTYDPGEVGTMLKRFDATNGAPQGHGFVTMHRGYLVVPFSADGGGGNGTGGLSFWDVSDPRNITNIFTTQNNDAYTSPALPDYIGDLREPHGYGVSGDVFCFTTNLGAGSGLEFWNLSDMDPPSPAPRKIGKIVLPLAGGDYSPTPWWVTWQGGRYAYVAGTSGGLFIVDASDPANPTLVNHLTTGQLGGFRVNVAIAVGNLLVLSMSDGDGIATLDISDPANPEILQILATGERAVGYSMMVNGDRILGANDPARVWDISDPTDITLVGLGPDVAGKGGYGMFQDGIFHYGSSSAYVRLDITQLPFVSLGTTSPPGFSSPDWDFANALGNLTFMGNDHAGSALVVNRATPDTTGPAVTMVSPRDGATSVALTSRVGLTFSDQIDLRSVTTGTLIVRPQGGPALPGRYSHQTGIVNFWPDSPLAPNTTYEVVVPAGGVQDFMGNPTESLYVSTFSTGETIAGYSLAVLPDPQLPAESGTAVAFDVQVSGSAPPLEFSWNFGDGSPATPWTNQTAVMHAFTQPGHYAVRVDARQDGQTNPSKNATRIQTVHAPLAAIPPRHSSTIIYDSITSGPDKVWCVNADNDTVTVIDAATLVKIAEIPVGDHPRTLTQGADGRIWVACQNDDTLQAINPQTMEVDQTFEFEYGFAPFGATFAPDETYLYVTSASHDGLQIIDLNDIGNVRRISFPVQNRAIAVTQAGMYRRMFMPSFIAPGIGSRVQVVFDANDPDLSPPEPVVGEFGQLFLNLALDPGPDREDSGRGMLNYITSIVVSPDGATAWLTAKKDNIERGLQRDGLGLSFENTVRTVAAQIDLATGVEDPAMRIDFNDADMASAIAFTPLGDYVFVALQGNNSVRVVDAYNRAIVGAVENTGLAPQGLAISPDGSRLYVHNFMSRSIHAYDITNLALSQDFAMPSLGEVATVADEALTTEVLRGKQVFYNADDPRMSLDHYLSCASCHLDGGQDGRIWDFTQRGEGLRNTTELNGRRGTDMGRVHWTANFDEIQDFENDIRNAFEGTGFLSDLEFAETSDALGAPKAGRNIDLDALAAYVGSLDSFGRSPYRDPERLELIQPGRDVFMSLRCFECHGGADFTDSAQGLIHDVGTIDATSGAARGFPVKGIDTPTLRGLWKTDPWLHNGNADSLMDIFTPQHGVPVSVSEGDRIQLMRYLLSLDDSEPAAQSALRLELTSPLAGSMFTPGTPVILTAATAEGIQRVEFLIIDDFADRLLLGSDSTPANGWALDFNFAPGQYDLIARAYHSNGSISSTRPIRIHDDTPPAIFTRINFQRADAPVPDGYEPDTGLPFGPRGNGFTYGWDDDTSSSARYHMIDPDPRYDTLVHFQKNGEFVWEIELPNGEYNLEMVFGDPAFTNQINNVNVEGTLLNDPDGQDNFDLHQLTVTVADGRLTIQAAPGASNAKICYIDIASVVAPAPSYLLAVGGGSGSGLYFDGVQVSISASSPQGYVFEGWTGDTQYLSDSADPAATVTMPAQDIAVQAQFRASSGITDGWRRYE